jgi:hypothetical protein
MHNICKFWGSNPDHHARITRLKLHDKYWLKQVFLSYEKFEITNTTLYLYNLVSLLATLWGLKVKCWLKLAMWSHEIVWMWIFMCMFPHQSRTKICKIRFMCWKWWVDWGWCEISLHGMKHRTNICRDWGWGVPASIERTPLGLGCSSK